MSARLLVELNYVMWTSTVSMSLAHSSVQVTTVVLDYVKHCSNLSIYYQDMITVPVIIYAALNLIVFDCYEDSSKP